MLQILSAESDDFIRLLAYDLLVRLEIRSLPVRSLRLFEIDKSVQYGSVQYLAEFFNLPIELVLSIGEAGFIYRERKDDIHRDQIFVNKDYPAKQILWNIALAIGALELDIVPYNTLFAIPQNLRSVTDFAYYFLAPDVVLDACKLYSQAELFEYCRLPFQESVKKARRLKHRLRKKKPIGAEKVILSNFEEYIWKLNFIRE